VLAEHGHDNLRLLRGSAFTTYLSIGVNLLGGFMRTYESDHPHITQFADSPWVELIVVKHAFLFAAMGAAIVLFERFVPRQRQRLHDPQAPAPDPVAHRFLVFLAFSGIAAAAVLGSASQVVTEFPEPPATPVVVPAHSTYQNFTGTWSGTPVQPALATGAFTVAPNATFLVVGFEPGMAASPQATLTGPDGTQHPVAFPNTGATTLITLDHPAPGAWSFTMTSPAVPTPALWSVHVKVAFPARAEGGDEHGH